MLGVEWESPPSPAARAGQGPLIAAESFGLCENGERHRAASVTDMRAILLCASRLVKNGGYRRTRYSRMISRYPGSVAVTPELKLARRRRAS